MKPNSGFYGLNGIFVHAPKPPSKRLWQRENGIAPFPFPLTGKAGAGGFPPRRQNRAAPPTRGLRPLVHPPNLVYAKIAKVFTMCLAQSVHYVSVPTGGVQ
jgi:hypothetical protein